MLIIKKKKNCQVLELKDNRPVTSWSPLGRLSSPEDFDVDVQLPSSSNKKNKKEKQNILKNFIDGKDKKKGNNKYFGGGGSSDPSKILKNTSSATARAKLGSNVASGRGFEITATTAALDVLGPGMGGSAVLGVADTISMQKFATQPAPQTAVVGSIVVLPCRFVVAFLCSYYASL